MAETKEKGMERFTAFVQEKMAPVANFMGSEKHLAAMQKGFMSVLPMIFVGAVFMIIANPPVTADMVASGGVWKIFSGWLNFAANYKMTILIPYNLTMGMLALYCAFTIAYSLAKSYKMPVVPCGMTSMVTFFVVAAPPSYMALADGRTSLLMPTGYLGAQGLFAAIIVALVTVEITRFCREKNITIKLPDSMPPSLAESFATIIPMLASVTIFFVLNLLIGRLGDGMSLPMLVENILAKPVSAVNSVPGALLLCAFILIMWCCGVHGNMVVMAVTSPISMAAFAANAEIFAAGGTPVFEPIFMTTAINMLGGTGNTFALCLLSLKWAKSEQMKAFGKATIVPSFFRLSEPAIFGAPIMYNPILMIPFVVGSLIVAVLYWLGCTAGFMTAPYLMVSGTFPIFLSVFVYTLDIRNCLFVLLMIPLTAVIWYPFFKAYDNQLYKNEQAALEEGRNSDA